MNHLRLINVIDVESLQDLRLDEMSNASLILNMVEKSSSIFHSASDIMKKSESLTRIHNAHATMTKNNGRSSSVPTLSKLPKRGTAAIAKNNKPARGVL